MSILRSDGVQDRCNNPASEDVPVWIDDAAPEVTLSLTKAADLASKLTRGLTTMQAASGILPPVSSSHTQPIGSLPALPGYR